MADLVLVLALLVGVVGLAVGFWMAWPPLGVIVGSLGCIALATAWARGEPEA